MNKLKIETKELVISKCLRKKIEMICSFANVKPTIINGGIKNIKCTNVAYVEPHKIIVNKTIFLMFDECDQVFINNLYNSIKLSELTDYIKNNCRHF